MSQIILEPHELADRWKVSTATLSHWRWSGKGPLYFKIGKHIHYLLKDVEDFEVSRRRRSTSGFPMEPDAEDERQEGKSLSSSTNVFPLMRRKKGGR